MEGNSWRPAQGDPTTAAMAGADHSAVDWRGQLLPEERPRIVNKIVETLKRHLPISVPEGLNELHRIAVRFEEKIYSAATSQEDYLQKISLKMLSMESKAHPVPINSGMSAGAVQPQNPGDPGIPQPQGPRQQFQHSHSMAQQQPSQQVAPMPMLENQMNQLQLVNMQPTANTMQQAGGASVLQPGREIYEE